jgi:chromosome partitioning protein
MLTPAGYRRVAWRSGRPAGVALAGASHISQTRLGGPAASAVDPIVGTAVTDCRTIAVANQKGGVAKTTTVASLGAAFAELGRKVLVVDLDPQACLTFSLGLDPDTVEISIHDVLLGRVSAGMAVHQTPDGPDLLPATIELAGCEAMLLTKTGREYTLRLALEDVRPSYDVILLDCAPSLGVLTLNALTAADDVLVPLQCETLSYRGVGQLLDTVHDVQRLTNRDLKVLGVLPTLFDGRTTHAREVLADVVGRYGLDVLEPPIAKSVRFAEAPAAGRSILRTAGRTPGAAAYRTLARSLAGIDDPTPESTVALDDVPVIDLAAEVVPS